MTGPDPDAALHAFATAGLWSGMSRTAAEGLVGAGIVTRSDVSVERLAALQGVNAQKASRLMSAFVAGASSLEFVGLLIDVGVPVRIAGRATEVLGRDVMRVLKDDPWALLAVPGVDPDTADRMARAVAPGVRRDDERRGRALVAHVLTLDARDGHTVMARDDVLDALAPFSVGDRDAALTAALSAQRVVAVGGAAVGDAAVGDRAVGGADISLTVLADAEAAIAVDLTRLVATADVLREQLSRPAFLRLDDTQRGAVRAAMRCGVSVLTGGPGTGKSATVAAVVDQCEQAGVSVALAAPTGRAAKRLEELAGAEATTVHRLLGARPRARQDDDTDVLPGLGPQPGGGRTWSSMEFERGEQWPLDQALVVVDEASMLDTELAAALFSACADGTHLVIVGDPAQLPSVGPGQVLADILGAVAGRADLPTTELTTLYRQAEGGAIARLATSVRGGTLPAVEPSPDREVVVVQARGSVEATRRVVQLVTDSIPRALGIPPSGIQVVTPVHGGGAGTIALNAALKAVLNPGTGRGGRFDVGDRVVATANHLEPGADGQPGFANGEVGTVTAVSGGTVTVEFSSGPAGVRGKALNDLSHGWAVTVHRAQGSEFPAVVVVLPPEGTRMLSRPLVYTALTRAQRHLSIVHAAGPAVARAVRQIGVQRRRTGLAERLTAELADL